MEYRLIRSDRKTIAIRVLSDGTVEVRAPKRAPQSVIDDALQKHGAWIQKHKANAVERYTPQIGKTAMLFGREFPLAAGRSTVLLDDKILLRYDSPPAVELAKLCQRAASQYFPHWLWELAAKERLSYANVKITSAKTRYGSCSGKNGICLSWRMACAPKRLIESVMLHELCHTIHHDHGDGFWKEVYRRMPDYDERTKELTEWAKKWFFEERENAR